MISFGIMSGLLVVMACLVHYDPFGWLPAYLYEERGKQHEPHGRGPEQTVFDFQDHPWIPRPGTDPNVAFSVRPTVLVFDDEDEDDDFWTDVTDADAEEEEEEEEEEAAGKSRSAGSGDVTDNGTCNGNAREVHTAPTEAPPPPPPPDYDEVTAEDYVAPGEERDDDVF